MIEDLKDIRVGICVLLVHSIADIIDEVANGSAVWLAFACLGFGWVVSLLFKVNRMVERLYWIRGRLGQ